MPASAGPTSIEAVAMPPAATFAAVSSDGVREIEGRMAAWMGRVRVIDEAAAAAPRYTTQAGASISRSRPVVPMAATCTR